MARMLVVLLLATGLTACGSARRGEPLLGLFTGMSPEAEAGERHFMAMCNACHPVGEAGIGLALNNKPLPGWAIRTQVR